MFYKSFQVEKNFNKDKKKKRKNAAVTLMPSNRLYLIILCFMLWIIKMLKTNININLNKKKKLVRNIFSVIKKYYYCKLKMHFRNQGAPKVGSPYPPWWRDGHLFCILESITRYRPRCGGRGRGRSTNCSSCRTIPYLYIFRICFKNKITFRYLFFSWCTWLRWRSNWRFYAERTLPSYPRRKIAVRPKVKRNPSARCPPRWTDGAVTDRGVYSSRDRWDTSRRSTWSCSCVVLCE